MLLKGCFLGIVTTKLKKVPAYPIAPGVWAVPAAIESPVDLTG
jgi:hypothetical protein